MTDLERVRPSSDPQPYALGPEVGQTIDLPEATDVVVDADPDGLIDRVASDLLVQAKECVRQFGDFHLALSGGSTPQPLYRRLMYDPLYRSLPWRRTHLWIVDERLVGFDHSDSNFGMIRELLVQHADIPEQQVHPIAATTADADMSYENELREHLGWREKGQDRLDFVLLGMGADGHTASLFPNSEALGETERLIVMNSGGETPDPGRVTMTFPLINAARFIGVYTCGSGKAKAIARVSGGADPVESLPIRGLAPVGGELKWYLDEAAASEVMGDLE